MLDVEFYRLYNGLWVRDLMPWFCRDFCDFHKSLSCFLPFFAVIFYCPYFLEAVYLSWDITNSAEEMKTQYCRSIQYRNNAEKYLLNEVNLVLLSRWRRVMRLDNGKLSDPSSSSRSLFLLLSMKHIKSHNIFNETNTHFKPRCRMTARKTLTSGIDCYSMSLIHHQFKAFKNWLNEIWEDMGF